MSAAKFDRKASAARGMSRIVPNVPMVSVGLGTCGIGGGAKELFEALSAKAKGSTTMVRRVGCFGYCAVEPLAMVRYPGKPVLLVAEAQAKDAARLLEAASSAEAAEKLAKKAFCKIETWEFASGLVEFGRGYPKLPNWDQVDFWKGQKKVVLRNCGLIDPESLDEYVATGGWSGLERALRMDGETVVKEIAASGLRGRGGAGFPTATKWELMRKRPESVKWVVCNADEGDPGAYMNRNEIESDPHALLEGMAVGARAMGATKGFVYVRAEYPLAVERLEKAAADARAAGILACGSPGAACFDLEIVRGAGAFVCGEETSLLASAEGRSGRARPRPPFPAEKGFGGMPTTINNVETWCDVSYIMQKGAPAFASLGVPGATGTKVFSLVGKVRNTGLVEVPLGTPLDALVYGMGGGAGKGKAVRAVQSGGPSGGCVPADKFGTPIEYSSLAALGAIMGSGGMVAMDRDNCMVDTARYFTSFTASESCGKCAPCREGLPQMKRILDSVSRGEARLEDLDELERLARVIRDTALCGLGQTAANPVLTTLQYFREEYEAHILDRRCEAGVCEDLFQALCENSCPLHMNIPAYLALVQEGRLEEAYEVTLRDNPLPGSIGRICHFHCQMRCRREQLDEPVSQGSIHRYLADAMRVTGADSRVWDALAKEKLPPTGRSVAVVGAGPAGLAAAFWLTRLGHAVTVHDGKPKAGGILRYGIPAYRLPPETLDHELGLWKKLGVKFAFRQNVDGKRLAELRSSNDAVIVATGAHADRPLGIPGETLAGVHPGYEWLERFAEGKAGPIGKRVLVIGGGNVALDAARTIHRLGGQVAIAYRRSRADMPANDEEVKGAEEEGIRIDCFLAPEEILGKGGRVSGVRFRVCVAGGTDASGRPKPVPTDRTVDIPCDDLIVAAGEKVDSSVYAAAGLPVLKDGRLAAGRRNGRLGATNVWAVGDAVTGPATASEAMGLAKTCARELDRELMGRDAWPALFRDPGYARVAPAEPDARRHPERRFVAAAERRGSFREISIGWTGEEARCEASRCLRCDARPNARAPWR